MLDKTLKQEIIKKFAQGEGDTGSTSVQVGILTARIAQISEHLKENPKDKHSRLGLVKLVGKRKTFLNYLKRTNRAAYDKLSAQIARKK